MIIFDQGVCLRVRKILWLSILGQFSEISDGHPDPFYPRVQLPDSMAACTVVKRYHQMF